MKTKIYDIPSLENIAGEAYNMISKDIDKAFESATKAILEGGTVAFPTETVYGLGANALSAKAIQKIFEAKGRPLDNPLILHIWNRDQLEGLVLEIPEKATKIMDVFWPGPLTIILPRKPEVPDAVTAGLSTVAVRMPDHPIAMKLLKQVNLPIAAPSANLSGRPSPTKGEHVVEDLNGRVNVIIKSNETKVGIESTVIDMSGDVPTILRPGIITKGQIESVIGRVQMDQALTEKDFQGIPRAPGMKYTHYAPKAAMTILDGQADDKKIEKINQLLIKTENISAGIASRKPALVLSEELARMLATGNNTSLTVYTYGSRRKPEQAAHAFFDILRKCDTECVDFIIAEALPDTDEVGFAVMNRMMKSAGHNIIGV